MRKTLTLLLSFVTIPFFVAACGGDDNNNPTGGGTTGTTLAELGDKLRDVFCTNAVECHRAETLAECTSSAGVQIEGIMASVEAGTTKYHPETVDACLEAFSGFFVCAYSESQALVNGGAPEACLAIFEGTVADGGDCSIDEACVSLNCESVDPNCSMQCCASKCAPKEMAPAKAKIGESCVDLDCESGAYCQYNMMGMKTTCAAEVAEGQPCGAGAMCKLPAFCDYNFQTMMGTCKVPSAHGAACDPAVAIACDRFDDVCDATSKTCVTKALPGAACGPDMECVDFAVCNDMTSKCEKLPVAGAACDDMNGPECLGDLNCINAKCALSAEPVCP